MAETMEKRRRQRVAVIKRRDVSGLSDMHKLLFLQYGQRKICEGPRAGKEGEEPLLRSRCGAVEF
jgi:hypothetical protein